MSTLLSRIFGRKKTDGDKNFVEIPLHQPPPAPAEPVTSSNATEFSGDTPMHRVLELYPAAQRALFQRYHIGGCGSCGYNPMETLEAVCSSRGLDVNEVTDHIKRSQELENRLEVEPRVVAEQLRRGEIKLLDVRTPEEYQMAHIEGAMLVSQELAQEIVQTWPKNTPVVTHCHRGIRSLDAAAYLMGHGFTNVKSMAGGIDAWSSQVDPRVPQY